MKGLELSEKFYKEYGEFMLHNSFSELEKYIAVGLVGSGSECFGFDDDISVDHDFEPGFCIFIPDEEIVNSKEAFALERAYAKLPKEFLGYKRNNISPVGGNRHGVIRISDFLKDKTGDKAGDLCLRDWFFVPEQSLAEVVNGKIFKDGYGLFSDIRQRLFYLPEAVRLKKIAGNLLLMGQAGQYNFERCLLRNETAAAQLALFEFIKSATHVIFLINKVYMPYYKWAFRAMRQLPQLSHLEGPIEFLVSNGNDEVTVNIKKDIINDICKEIICLLKSTGITESNDSYETEKHAYFVNDKIINEEIRNLHILYGV